MVVDLKSPNFAEMLFRPFIKITPTDRTEAHEKQNQQDQHLG